MAVKKVDSGWLVDSQPGGRGGKRFRKTFTTQAEAKQYDAWLKTQVAQSPDWAPERRDTRKLSELVDLWHQHHGVNLRAASNTYGRLKLMVAAMGDPVADRFTVDTFTEYRTKRIAAGITLNNLNREHAYLRAVFNELSSLGHWKKDNPLAKLRQFKIQERELSFLTLDQIATLLKALVSPNNRHTLLISKVCLTTGARWGEAEMLKTSQLRGNVIQFAKTKSGKVRAVPISEDLRKELLAHHDPKETGNRFFANAYSAFREAIERAKIELPEGQLTHVLRHTFASHFMMRRGNILTLNKILGHASLAMTMRYAHLAPEHLQEAILFNPLAPAAKPKKSGSSSAQKKDSKPR